MDRSGIARRPARPGPPLAALLCALAAGACAHAPEPVTPARPPTLAELHLREAFRGPLRGSAVVLPLLECTSEGVPRIANLTARAASFTLADELWRRLGLPGEPEPDEAGRLAEHLKLCKELADNRDSGVNHESASPHMRELLRDFFRRHTPQSWLVVSTRWLRLGDALPGSVDQRAVGVLGERRYETDVLESNLYVFGRQGDIVFRADLSCLGQKRGEEHDCGEKFEKIPARVGELVEGFPRAILEKAAIIRVTPDLPSRREEDPTLDFVPPHPIELPIPPNELVDEDGQPIPTVKAKIKGKPRGKGAHRRAVKHKRKATRGRR